MFLKKELTLLLLSVFAEGLSISAQMPVPDERKTGDTITTITTEEGKIFNKVEIEASYPGGEAAWRRYLEQNLNAETPVKHKAPAGTYTVVIQFVVDKHGVVSDIRALTNHGYEMEEEVIRLLKKAPRWNPAVQDGRIVRAYRKQPVTFMVLEESRKEKRKNRS